jgi:hypothetical protein
MSIDFTSPEGKVRLNIGDVNIPYMLQDSLISAFLSKYQDQPEYMAVYNATIDSLLVLKGQFALTAARRREREGSVEIEEYSAEKYKAISDLLDYWKENPPEGILPSNFAGFIFGGVSKAERKRVDRNPDSFGPFEGFEKELPVIPDWRLE